MTLLIVDDQSQVVKGILNGVNWAAEGFSEVFAAYNAAEAKQVLGRHEVDVMLCDIEMPVENGLTLVEWLRNENMQTRCIFLTSHMSFDYAQKALRLGSQDYIVQPVPYSEIRDAVRKVTRDKLKELGRLKQQREIAFTEGVLHSYAATGAESVLNDAGFAGLLPNKDALCYLVMVRAMEPGEIRDIRGFHHSVEEIISDLFIGYGQKCYAIGSDETRICFLVYGDGYLMDFEGVIRQLESMIRTAYTLYPLACFTGDKISIHNLPGLYARLWKRSGTCHGLQSRVYVDEPVEEMPENGIEEIKAYIRSHMEDDIRCSELSAYFHINPDYLTRVFKKETGQTLKEYITNEKITTAQRLLRTTNLQVGMIAVKVGFSSLSHFSKVYQRVTGWTPS
jgi:two-component system response regulator YesN